MPGRALPLVNEEIYHVFNRGIDHRSTFTDELYFQRALDSIDYYRYQNPPLSFSKYSHLDSEKKEFYTHNILKKQDKLISLINHCLMPNHFHLLIRQLSENGISKFMSNFQNSFTRYFNLKDERIGPLFLDQFKAVRIETDEQLLHVSRYIHLNPYSSNIIKNIDDLKNYKWSSFKEYITGNEGLCDEKDLILSNFSKNNTYENFVKNQADYQRKLDLIKHQILE